MNKYILNGLCMSAFAIFGADVIGSVSSTNGLQLNGKAVPVAGTKSWPISSGDELKSDGVPVVLTMKDGSKILLGKNSTAKLDGSTVRLMAGTVQYSLAGQSSLQVAVKSDVLSNRAGVASTLPGPLPPATPVVTPAVVKSELPPVSRRLP